MQIIVNGLLQGVLFGAIVVALALVSGLNVAVFISFGREC